MRRTCQPLTHHSGVPDLAESTAISTLTLNRGNAARGHVSLLARWAAWSIGVALVLRFVAMWFVPLIPEEAYYWMYAQHPALSYFDHPPMVAWVIGLGTTLFGDSEFGVRIVGCLLSFASSGLMYWFSRRWYGHRAGLLAALALVVLPVYFAIGFIATMDAAQMFFTLVALTGMTIALKDGRASGWYLAGLGIGAAMLCKYTGAFIGLGAIIACVGCRPWRRQLRSPHPYLAALLAIAIFSPVLIWNAEHQWASFRFQFVDRFATREFSAANVAGFLFIQLIIMTPVGLVALGWLACRVARHPRRALTRRRWFALSFSVPLLAMMAWKSLTYSTHINWTLPAYLSLLPAIAHISIANARRLQSRGIRRDGLREVQWTGLICAVISAGIVCFLLVAQPILHTLSAFGPWRPAAALAQEYASSIKSATGQDALTIAQEPYRLASMLAFYRNDTGDRGDLVTSQWFIRAHGLGYEYWSDPARWIGTDCVCVGKTDEWLAELPASFDSVEVVTDPRLAQAKIKIAIGRGYRGPSDRRPASEPVAP